MKRMIYVILLAAAVSGCYSVETLRAFAPLHKSILQGAPRDIAYCFQTDKSYGPDEPVTIWGKDDGSVVNMRLAPHGVLLWEATLTQAGEETDFEMRAIPNRTRTAGKAIALIESCGQG